MRQTTEKFTYQNFNKFQEYTFWEKKTSRQNNNIHLGLQYLIQTKTTHNWSVRGINQTSLNTEYNTTLLRYYLYRWRHVSRLQKHSGRYRPWSVLLRRTRGVRGGYYHKSHSFPAVCELQTSRFVKISSHTICCKNTRCQACIILYLITDKSR